ncbi:hypothetical protein JTB14_033397 [Gonioctena quinquepunctata]|nr:hypothetical protein JTB14_033397 [Gonioctena quinquepunctata]
MKNIEKAPIYTFLERWLGDGLLRSTGTKWQTRRKILTPAFHFTILQQFVTVFNNETDRLVDVLKKEVGKSWTNIVPLISEFTLYTIAESSMGTKLNKENKEDKRYMNSIYQMGKMIFYRVSRPWLFFQRIYYNITFNGIRERKLIEIIHNFTDNIIDDQGIRDEVNTFMFEGYDTTSASLSFILMLFANHRNWQDLIYREVIEIIGESGEPPTLKNLNDMKIMERFIKESLRLYPSVPFIGRVFEEDMVINGYLLPKGEPVHFHIFDIHRNPKYWTDPEIFDPDRFLPDNCVDRHPFAYVPFSAGPRNCIGQKFAILEQKAVLCGILKNFILEPIDTPENLLLVPDMVLRTHNHSIRVKLSLR